MVGLPSSKFLSPTAAQAVRRLRPGNPAWPPPTETWTNHSQLAAIALPVLMLLVIQISAQAWSAQWSPFLYESGSLPADRPIWTMAVLLGGLWLGYIGGPVFVNNVAGLGPGAAINLRSNGAQTVLAVAVGVGTQLGALPVVYWLVELFVDTGDPGQQAADLVARINTTADVVLLGLIVVVLAPLVEEWFYRGFFLSVLSLPVGRLGASIVCSIVFALVHGSLVLVPGLMVFSLAVCALTIFTGRLGPAIVAHMAFNATALTLLLRSGW